MKNGKDMKQALSKDEALLGKYRDYQITLASGGSVENLKASEVGGIIHQLEQCIENKKKLLAASL